MIDQIKSNDIEKRWYENVKEATAIVSARKYNQMKVAELALEVCEISWGGASKEYKDKYTLKRFAKEVGLNIKTLSTWINIKRNVFDKLPFELQSKASYTAMHTVGRFVNNDTSQDTVTEKFKIHVSLNQDNARMLRYCQQLRAIAHNFEVTGKAARCKKATLEEIVFYCKLVLKNIKDCHDITTGKDHGLSAKYGVIGGKLSAARSIVGDKGTRKEGWFQDEDGFRVKISEKDNLILDYLKKHSGKAHSPTALGMKLGKHNSNSASAWSYRTLNKFVAIGLVERDKKGHYKFKEENSLKTKRLKAVAA